MAFNLVNTTPYTISFIVGGTTPGTSIQDGVTNAPMGSVWDVAANSTSSGLISAGINAAYSVQMYVSQGVPVTGSNQLVTTEVLTDGVTNTLYYRDFFESTETEDTSVITLEAVGRKGDGSGGLATEFLGPESGDTIYPQRALDRVGAAMSGMIGATLRVSVQGAKTALPPQMKIWVTQASLVNASSYVSFGSATDATRRFTFYTSPSSDYNQVGIGSSDAEAAANLATGINNYVTTRGFLFAKATGNVVDVIYQGPMATAREVGIHHTGTGTLISQPDFAPTTATTFHGQRSYKLGGAWDNPTELG